MVKIKEFALFFALLLLGLFLTYLYQNIHNAKEDIFARIERKQILQVSNLLKNIENDMLGSLTIKSENDLYELLKDDSVRKKYEHIASLLLTSNIKYAYILHKDERGRFRFLLDASKDDKANFYQKFDVATPEYDMAYKTKKPQFIKQHNMENLYITCIRPIVKENRVVGLFSVDITTDIQKSILDAIEPIERFFIVLIMLIVLFALMTIVQILSYFITRKKIFTDPLTKAFNRNYLEEILPGLNLGYYSLVMLDLDKFKVINDTYGHKAGDFVLVNASAIFRNSITNDDILVRYGGEEFLILLNNRKSDEPPLFRCEKIRENIKNEQLFYDGHEIKMSVSMGLHPHPVVEKNLQEAIKIADKMLYVAKNSGRNRTISYDEKNSNETQVSKNIAFVKEALDENRVVCYYQPIYDHKKSTIYKHEALVRIIANDGTLVMPMQFLPELKDTNMHYKLTQRILSIAFKSFRNNNKNVSINVNFSDLINQDIENSIIESLSEDSNLASRVTFEILESDEINNVALFKEKISTLRALGAKVSIDDFGSGYSNFKTIIDVEANYLKIDGSLIKNIDKNIKDFKVVESIVHFAKQSNMQTVAEFVHSKEVFEKLLELDIDYMQGYYISAPKATILEESELFH